MAKHKVLYFSHAPENVYEIIRQEVPDGFELSKAKGSSLRLTLALI